MYSSRGHHEKALPYLVRVEDEARQTGSALLMAHALRERGELERSMTHLPEALRYFSQAR